VGEAGRLMFPMTGVCHMPSSLERLGLKVVHARTFDLPQPRTFIENTMEAGSFGYRTSKW